MLCLDPLRAPEPLPTLNPSNFVPKNRFPVVKGLRVNTYRINVSMLPEGIRVNSRCRGVIWALLSCILGKKILHEFQVWFVPETWMKDPNRVMAISSTVTEPQSSLSSDVDCSQLYSS